MVPLVVIGDPETLKSVLDIPTDVTVPLVPLLAEVILP
jgi:hypothetical protein